MLNLRSTRSHRLHIHHRRLNARVWISYLSMGVLIMIGGSATIGGLSSGCVGEVTPPKLDAYIGGGGGSGDVLPDLLPPRESRFLTFESRSGTLSLSLGTQEVKAICEAGYGLFSADSERILCIPESASSPIRFIDRISGLIMELIEWDTTDLAEPTMPLEGSVFASLVEVPDELNYVAIYNDFGFEVARMKTTRIGGFLGPEHLVINNPSMIWSFADPLAEGVTTIDEAEELGFATAIGSREFIRHDYLPYGVIYSDRDDVYFFGVGDDASTKLGEGYLIGVAERRAIVISSEGGSEMRLSVFDVGSSPGSDALFSVPVTGVNFGRSYRAQMIGRSSVLLQFVNSRICGGDEVEYALESYLVRLKSGDITPLETSGDPHQVAASEGGKYAITRYLDNCGRGMGNAKLVKLSDGEQRDLPSDLRGKVKGAAASAAGGYLAVMGETQVWLLDGDSLESRVAHSGEPILGGLRFTQ